MFQKINYTRLSLGGKLTLATLVAVIVIMVVLVFAISTSVTRTIQSRVEVDMQQKMDMVHGFLTNSDGELRQRVQSVAQVFKNEHAKTVQLVEFGERKALLLNGAAVNGDHALLDRFEALTSARSAVFIFDGNQFKSIASSVKNDKGEPAVGVYIEKETERHKVLLNGEDYIQITNIFGDQYFSLYSPLFDGNKKLVGAYFVGLDFTDLLEDTKKMLRQMKVGTSGYYFVVLNEGPERGVIAIHPRLEGENLWGREDSKGGKYIQHILTTQRGVHVYDVINAKDGSARTMVTAYDTYKPWNWTIAATINQSEIMDANKHLYLIFLVLGVIAVAVLTGAVYFVIRRTVVQPLSEGLQITQAMAQGDLTQRAHVRSNDEIGRLLGAINGTADALAGLIRTVKEKSSGVTLASHEIARGNADLAIRTESSASALEQTAAAMEELGATVRHNADNATVAETIARQTQGVVTESGHTVTALVETMGGIDQSSQRIADIIGVIDGIAFQTNILALNAAVEAARAGEHGRGFAVVASEVRSLAGRSAEAAKEIKQLIQSSVDNVRTGNDRAEAAGTAMEQAMQEITKVARVISEISHASVEQRNGVGQVAEAITSMDHATQKNAALVEEMAAAAESLSAQANELLEAVAIFKLSEANHQITQALGLEP